jgi:hypothetical protein
MKLTIIVLIGVIILSLLFKSSNTVEGLEDSSPDYTGIITVKQQVDMLKKSVKKVDSIGNSEMDYTKKAELRGKIEIFIQQLDGWVQARAKYIEKNNAEKIKPKKNETLDGLRTIWFGENNNGTGIKTLFDVVIGTLDIGDDKQSEIDDILKIVVKNMDSVLA